MLIRRWLDMATNDYQFITNWRIEDTKREVCDILDDAEAEGNHARLKYFFTAYEGCSSFRLTDFQ
jgi:hypothetical protein